MDKEEMRKAFEAYLRKKYHDEDEQSNPWFLWVHGNADHSYVYTQHEWEAWQAAMDHSGSLAEVIAKGYGGSTCVADPDGGRVSIYYDDPKNAEACHDAIASALDPILSRHGG